MANKDLTAQIENLLKPLIEALGYELWGVEIYLQGHHSVLRVYIDHFAPSDTQDATIVPKYIGLQDCSSVSDAIGPILDVEDLIKGKYSLEVSSPGFDRPLFKIEQYQRFIGKTVHLKLAGPVNNRRKYTGRIEAINNNNVVIILENNETLTVPFAQIEKANIHSTEAT